MDKIVIKGGNKLTGEVKVEGAKMQYYQYWQASLLASDKPSKLVNVPALSDVETINNVLTTFKCWRYIQKGRKCCCRWCNKDSKWRGTIWIC